MKILRKIPISDSITAFAVESPYPRPDTIRYGIDPGTVNLGIAYVHPTPNVTVMLYQVKLKRADTMMGRILSVQNALTQCRLILQPNAKAIIEGAAFGNKFRQVEMAEVRAGIGMWFHPLGIEVQVVPPLTIRKSVFGSGKIKNPWEGVIPDDVAAALGCAYYDSSNISISSS